MLFIVGLVILVYIFIREVSYDFKDWCPKCGKRVKLKIYEEHKEYFMCHGKCSRCGLIIKHKIYKKL